MLRPQIRLAWYQVIDASATGSFEQLIFHDSYAEFQLKVQAYTRGHALTRFSSILAYDGRASSLHYKTGFGVQHHIEALNKQIPGLQDTAGRMNIPFETSEFNVLESDTADKQLHRVAITYITDSFTLLNNFAEYLVLAAGPEDEQMTFTIKMQPGLSIVHYEEVMVPQPLRVSAA
ncbi:MAG: hypothetical protein ABW019_04720 [Chitinophagaceae bacterium]